VETTNDMVGCPGCGAVATHTDAGRCGCGTCRSGVARQP
jgi:hypothetical protein